MFLEKIILTHFKNYEHQTLVFSDRFNAFVGLNGMGKTNLLDAIYYLCMTKSYLQTGDSDVILRGNDGQTAAFMRLEGHFKKGNTALKIAAKVQARKRKIFEKNDVAYTSLAEHIGLLPVVIIAPDDTELVKDGSEARRRFLDNTLSQLDTTYLNHLVFYHKILEQRNALLKKADTTEGVGSLLDYYDGQLLAPAHYIYEKRQAFLQAFEPIFNDVYRQIAGASETVHLSYESQLIATDFKILLSQNREKDSIIQRSSQGIHKDDIVFKMNDRLLKKFGSQGQLKSFVIALKLAQYALLREEKSEHPILLLDDIFDKLDDQRVINLMQLIVETSFGQVFITDTRPERIATLFETIGQSVKTFEIERGRTLN